MNVERIERVIINVKNLEEAVKFFTDILGLEWEPSQSKDSAITTPAGHRVRSYITEHADPVHENARPLIARSTIGFQLMQRIPPEENEGFRSLCLKVSNIEEAKARMKKKGIRLLKEQIVGGMREVMYHPDDCYGVRLTLEEYDAPTHREATMQELKVKEEDIKDWDVLVT